MQLLVPAKFNAVKQGPPSAILLSLRRLFQKRTAIGFTIGEALFWFGFVVMWPAILGSIYFFGGMFDKGVVMPLNKFIVVSAVVACCKALVIVPFWWLSFRRLRGLSTLARVFLHLPIGAIYSTITVFFIYHIKTKLLGDHYPVNTVLADGYNMLTAYFMNFILFHAYNFWLSTQRQQKKEQELRELAFQSEINALRTQIEPHFLFNTLNSISASVPPSLEKTRVLISQLADTFRYALRVSKSPMVALGDELTFTKTWLSLEQQRFEDRLAIHYDIDIRTLGVPVPSMLLQPLVENALNHGIAPKVGGGSVSVVCKLVENGSVYVAVSDTGLGYEGDLSGLFERGVGLRNTARRLKLLYNETLQVQRQQHGLRFSFHLPNKPFYETAGTDH